MIRQPIPHHTPSQLHLLTSNGILELLHGYAEYDMNFPLHAFLVAQNLFLKKRKRQDKHFLNSKYQNIVGLKTYQTASLATAVLHLALSFPSQYMH